MSRDSVQRNSENRNQLQAQDRGLRGPTRFIPSMPIRVLFSAVEMLISSELLG